MFVEKETKVLTTEARTFSIQIYILTKKIEKWRNKNGNLSGVIEF